MRVHIEGMGILGSLVALRLHRLQVPFTWHDTGAKVNSWMVSTGCIYPGSTEQDLEGWEWWKDQFNGGFPEGAGIIRPDCIERARWVYNHHKPPHNAEYEHIRNWGMGDIVLHEGALPSFHLNAQQFVPDVRAMFADRKSDKPKKKDLDAYIVAHGFGKRLDQWVWGWTVPVTLSSDPDGIVHNGERSAIYFRKGRFVLCYAYPIPNTPHWYAGSSLIVQKNRAKELEVMPKFLKWQEWLGKLSGGRVQAVQAGMPMQGWRPRETPDSWTVQRSGKNYFLPSMWHNGIRHAPPVIRDLTTKMHNHGLIELPF